MEYSPTDLLLYALGGIFVVASVVAVLMLFPAIEHGGANDWIRAVAFAAIALAALWAMAAWQPTVVAVRDGVLEVTQGSRTQTADLRDPAVRVQTAGSPSSPGWRVTVHRPGERPIVVRGNQVRRRQFDRIVSYHQAHPRPPEEQQEHAAD